MVGPFSQMSPGEFFGGGDEKEWREERCNIRPGMSKPELPSSPEGMRLRAASRLGFTKSSPGMLQATGMVAWMGK